MSLPIKRYWHFLRYFALELPAQGVGFSAQSPTGQGCQVDFTQFQYRACQIANLRNGE